MCSWLQQRNIDRITVADVRARSCNTLHEMVVSKHALARQAIISAAANGRLLSFATWHYQLISHFLPRNTHAYTLAHFQPFIDTLCSSVIMHFSLITSSGAFCSEDSENIRCGTVTNSRGRASVLPPIGLKIFKVSRLFPYKNAYYVHL